MCLTILLRKEIFLIRNFNLFFISHMNKHTFLLIIISLTLYSFFDGDGNEKIKSAILSYLDKYPQEKIYITTDESFYVTGESIWYKVFCTAYNRPSKLSKIAYVQLINEKGNIVILDKLPLLQGNGNGDIQLSDSLKTGVYQLRGFTSWMLNFEDCFFEKAIYIKNIKDTVEQSSRQKQSLRYDIHFFPEGSDLVDSNLCHIAFKATDQFGLPAAVSGEIKDDNQNTLASLQTYHDGMGEFDIRPFPNRQYYASVHFPDNSIKNVELPTAKPSGISIHVTNQTPASFDITITYKGANLEQFEKLVLAAYQGEGKAATFSLQMHRGKNVFTIPKEGFSEGILRLTIFDKLGNPCAERIIFIEHKDEMQASLQNDSISFKPKNKSSFTLKLKTIDGKAIKEGNYSIAVTDADNDGQDNLQGNIYSGLLLKSELKGYIHNPAYYFINTNDSAKKALDLIMQTNGWRRLQWKQLLNKEPVILRYPIEQDLYVAGEITNYSKVIDKNQFHLNIVIQKADSGKYAGFIKLDSGKFILENYNFTGTSLVYFNWFADKNTDTTGIAVKLYTSSIDSVLSVTPSLTPIHNMNFLSGNSLIDISNNEQKKRSLITASFSSTKQVSPKSKSPIVLTTSDVIKKYTSSFFQTPGTYTIDMINDSFPTIPGFYQLIKGKIPSLIIGGNERNPQFYYQPLKKQISSVDTGMQQKSYPYFYLNEVLVSYEALRKIPLESIALIRYIPSPFLMAPANGGSLGTIAVYLKKGDDVHFRQSFSTKDNTPFIYKGYSITREFYEPDYSIPSSANALPDTRRTLYWNPNVKPDEKGTFHFSFYNNDVTKKYRIIVEGLDEEGKLFHFDTVVKE